MALTALSGCAVPAQAPGPKTAAGVWQVRLPEGTSAIASKAHGTRGDGVAWDSRGSDSIDEFLRKDYKRVAAPRARAQDAVARTQPLPKAAPAPQAPATALPPAPEPQPLLASATPAERPDTSELTRYAERDAQAKKAQRFSGGDAVIVVSATTVLIVLLIILIIVLID